MEEIKKWSSFETAKNKLASEIVESKTVYEILTNAANLWKDKIYLQYPPTGEEFSYGKFKELVDRVSSVFVSKGISIGDRIALFMKNSPWYLASIFACGKIGAVEVPVNWFYREREVEYIVNNSRSSLVIADEDLYPVVEKIRDKLPTVKSVIKTTGDGESLSRLVNAVTLAELGPGVDENDLFAIIYTSGTTGLPKGAMLTHSSYVLSAKAISLWPIEDIESDYTCLPLFHINAQIYSSLGMMVGGRRLILSDRFTPQKFWKEIKDYSATAFNALGSLMQIIYSLPESPEDKTTPAKYVIVGGTPLELWDKFETRYNLTILEGYSQTEDPLPFLNHPDKDKRMVGSFGVPSFWDLGHEVKVVNDKGEEVGKGETGELIRKSPCTMKGYFMDEERTRETLKDGWLYSGDIVRRDERGFTYFVERKKFIIRRSGENIAAWEVEAVIKDHPAVKDCAVIPVKDPMRGEEIKAIVLLKEGEKIDPQEIVLYVGKQLAYFKVPRYIEFVESLPYTPTGRVKKHELISQEKEKADHGWDRNKEMPDWRKRIEL